MSPADRMMRVVTFFMLVVVIFKFFIPFVLELLYMVLSAPFRVISHAIHNFPGHTRPSR